MLPPLFVDVTKKSRLWILYILYLLFRFAHFLLEVPTMRMIEYAACHQQHHRLGSDAISMLAELDEAACKTATVQEQVTRVVGWKMSFDAIPGVYPSTVPHKSLTGLWR